MTTLNKTEASMLRALQKDEAWGVVLRMLGKRVDELGARATGTLAGNAFEELRVLHKCQGGVEELKQFFEDIERCAFE